VGDVKAFDHLRRRIQPEGLLELHHAHLPGIEHGLDVLFDKVEEPSLCPDLRHRHGHPLSPGKGEEFCDRFADRFRQDDLGWYRVVGVVLDKELFKKIRVLLKGELALIPQGPPVDIEEHQVHGSLVSPIADDILVPLFPSGDVLPV